jgi:hypothetical protein
MADREIGKIKKSDDTDIILRIDDFGGSMGLTIREFVNSDKYKGFTKAGVRIRSDKFEDFKKMVDSIKLEDFGTPTSTKTPYTPKGPTQSSPGNKTFEKKKLSEEEDSGINEEGLM